MEDKLGKAANLANEDADTTAVKFDQPEPGHLVFAGKDEEKTTSVPPAQRPVVPVPPPQEADSINVVPKDQSVATESPSEAAGAASSTDSSSSTESSIPSDTQSTEQEKEQGPAEEAEAEAERARKELFPEESA